MLVYVNLGLILFESRVQSYRWIGAFPIFNLRLSDFVCHDL